MSRRAFFLALGLAVLAIPEAAQACRVSAFQTPILHDVLPALSEGLVAADVEITAARWTPDGPRLEGRIVSMIAGNYRGTTLRVEPQGFTSCDTFPEPGGRGIAVGRVLSASEDALVIDPVRAPSAMERRRNAQPGAARGKR